MPRRDGTGPAGKGPGGGLGGWGEWVEAPAWEPAGIVFALNAGIRVPIPGGALQHHESVPNVARLWFGDREQSIRLCAEKAKADQKIFPAQKPDESRQWRGHLSLRHWRDSNKNVF